jgi:hypothetical protein
VAQGSRGHTAFRVQAGLVIEFITQRLSGRDIFWKCECRIVLGRVGGRGRGGKVVTVFGPWASLMRELGGAETRKGKGSSLVLVHVDRTVDGACGGPRGSG